MGYVKTPTRVKKRVSSRDVPSTTRSAAGTVGRRFFGTSLGTAAWNRLEGKRFLRVALSTARFGLVITAVVAGSVALAASLPITDKGFTVHPVEAIKVVGTSVGVSTDSQKKSTSTTSKDSAGIESEIPIISTLVSPKPTESTPATAPAPTHTPSSTPAPAPARAPSPAPAPAAAPAPAPAAAPAPTPPAPAPAPAQEAPPAPAAAPAPAPAPAPSSEQAPPAPDPTPAPAPSDQKAPPSTGESPSDPGAQPTGDHETPPPQDPSGGCKPPDCTFTQDPGTNSPRHK